MIVSCVVTALVVTTGCDRAPSPETTPITADVPLEANPSSPPDPIIIFKLSGDAVPDIKVEQILAWIKTKRPEWDTNREKLLIYLASQPFIDKWLKDEYDLRKKAKLPVPEYFNEPGRTAAFFTIVDGINYIYLPWDFTLSSIADEDTLVHELVHYVLRRNGFTDRCPGDAEFVAHFHVVLYLLEEKKMASDSEQVLWNMQQASEYICDSE